MPVTTVLNEDGTTIIAGDNDNDGFFRHRFSWSAAFAGAFLATALTFLLLALGAGFGLALTSPQHVATPTFLTLGAIYFLAAQTFGFAAGGHLAGRLIGPAPETAAEEEFRSAAHGLVVWALAVVATATMVALGSFAIGGSALIAAKPITSPSSVMGDGYVAYWVDMLFRPGTNPSQASLDGIQFAQAETGIATDAAPSAGQPIPPTDSPETTPPPSSTVTPPQGRTETAPPTLVTPATSPAGSVPSRMSPQDTMIPTPSSSFAAPQSLAADKAEVGRILTVDMADQGQLNQYDKDRMAGLIAQDTGIGAPEAQRRVENAETRIHADEVHAAEVARKTASYASLWIAFSLLFGAIVAAMAAMSARWKDDAVTFGWSRRDPA